MGRSQAYLVDRARIHRVVPVLNSGVVSREDSRQIQGDWINARLTPVTGVEGREMAQVKLVHTHDLILDRLDASGNEVFPIESDQFEIMVDRNNELSKSVEGFKIVGAILEVRKRTRVQSYVIPLTLETEF